ncbi:hypothetical protein [Halomonas binhaiensis]|uniref:Bacteriocin n=1 Tax=Halomonas binhaiensis TaxID=2562282 RepID=A0A5C1NGC1_9GAMM|nr:hypothetical protein [Halomonas binhaiensis]QEM81683.1 hypothetical protein E4T21_09090 [Halomonas binhaiensis]
MNVSEIRTLNEEEIGMVSGGATYDQAYESFIDYGSQLGAAVGALLAGSYTSTALSPTFALNFVDSFGDILEGFASFS